MPDKSALRSYVVVRVDGDTLTIMGTVKARHQDHAIDLALRSITPDERMGSYGAFLESSYREVAASAEVSVVIHKTPCKREFKEATNG